MTSVGQKPVVSQQFVVGEVVVVGLTEGLDVDGGRGSGGRVGGGVMSREAHKGSAHVVFPCLLGLPVDMVSFSDVKK